MSAQLSALLLAAALFFAPLAEARIRSVRGPSLPVDATTVAGWLASNAYPIYSVELQPWDSDIQAVGHLIDDATVVGLGDGTHGTHEFYTVKLRLIDYLVRERNFDVITFEGPVPQWERLNEYVLGGAGEPRAILAEAGSEPLNFVFWDAEEMVAVVEWMRAYNFRRGNRAPVQILGADVFGQVQAWKSVVTYLRTADPLMAAEAEREYACVGENAMTITCLAETSRVRDALAAARGRLIAATNENAFEIAMLAARVVAQNQEFRLTARRDQNMAENVLWIRDNRSVTGRVIYWGHNGHTNNARMEFSSTRPAGQVLRETIGSGYYSIGTMTSSGSFLQWPVTGGRMDRVVSTFPALSEGMYETYFRQHGAAALLIPLRGTLPQWLAAPARFNTAGVSGNPARQPMTLATLFDAVIWMDQTTPLHPLRPWPQE